MEKYNITFYKLVTHSPLRKSGKFHYINYRIEKNTLLLAIQDSTITVSLNTFFV